MHACDLVASDHPFLFPSTYRQFMQYLGDYDVDFSDVCTSKSRLLTFLGNEFGEPVTPFILVQYFIGQKLTCILYCLIPSMLTAAVPVLLKTIIQTFLNHQVHELVNHQKSASNYLSMKLAFDVDQFDTVRFVAMCVK